jgi:hypothetical protein
VFFYNSFDDELIRKMLANIEHSRRASGCDMFVVYRNPTLPAAFDSAPFLQRLTANAAYNIYRAI